MCDDERLRVSAVGGLVVWDVGGVSKVECAAGGGEDRDAGGGVG